jgi:hypothetical protein
MTKAYAYTELSSQTAHYSGPVKSYILEFGILSALTTGIGQISTTNESAFKQILQDQQKNIQIITSKLPSHKKAIEEIVLVDDVSIPTTVTIKRLPLDKNLSFFVGEPIRTAKI